MLSNNFSWTDTEMFRKTHPHEGRILFNFTLRVETYQRSIIKLTLSRLDLDYYNK
jgi:hypothetical protein